MTMTQRFVLAAKKINGLLGCIRQSIATRLKELILALCLPLVRSMCYVQYNWAPQYKKGIHILEHVH